MFEKYFGWAFSVGKAIINSGCGKERGRELVRRLIFEIRGEDTPGRFLDKLVERLSEYKTNTSIKAKIEILPEIMLKEEWRGDKFCYLKSSILAGLLNSLSIEDENMRGDVNE